MKIRTFSPIFYAHIKTQDYLSSKLKWYSLKVKGKVQIRKGLQWIPMHPETRKGIVSDEMLQRAENTRRSGDSRLGQHFQLLLNPQVGKRQPGKLKNLSSQRKGKGKRNGSNLNSENEVVEEQYKCCVALQMLRVQQLKASLAYALT